MSKDNAPIEAAASAPSTPDVQKKDGGVKKTDKPKASKPAKDKEKVGIFRRIGRFFKDVKGEFKKIVWPSKKQVWNNTLVVLAFMLVVAVGVWLLDYLFINLFRLIY